MKTESYKTNISSNYGQITNKLDDIIQSSDGVSLRAMSLKEMINCFPTDYYLAQTVNGVKLEYLIKEQESKCFYVETRGQATVFHIFEDLIITGIPDVRKIFVDSISSNIKCNVSSTTTAFKITQQGVEKLIFNATNGIYFCNIKQVNPLQINNGKKYFDKIEIPASLKGEQLQSVSGNVYVFGARKDFNIPYPNNNLDASIQVPSYLKSDLNLSTIYLENTNFNLGDIIEFKYTVSGYISFKISKEPTVYTSVVTAEVVDTNVSGFTCSRNGNIMMSPTFDIPDINPSIQPSSLIEEIFFDIPQVKTPVTFTKLKILNGTNYAQKFLDIFRYNLYLSINNEFPNLKNFDTIYPPFKLPFLFYFKYYQSYRNPYVGQDLCYSYNSITFYYPNTNIKLIQSSVQDNNPILAPYTPFAYQNRLAVSYLNTIKFSETGNFENFTIPSSGDVKATEPFERTFANVNEIKWIANWGGNVGNTGGFAVGSDKGVFFLSSIANPTDTEILRLDTNISCSYVKPIQIQYNGYPALLIVSSDRRVIKGVVFIENSSQSYSLSDTIDFFDNDPIKKIEYVKYAQDNLLFVLTDSNKLYGCITGGKKLAWFQINLNYAIKDIMALDSQSQKKLFIVSSLNSNSDYSIVGSMDFFNVSNDGVVKAEFYIDDNMASDFVFNDTSPEVNGITNYAFPDILTEEQKAKLPKSIIAKLSFHNQEMINNKLNTKALALNRYISDVRINIKNSNAFDVDYDYKTEDYSGTIKAFEYDKTNSSLDITPINDYIKIYQQSPIAQEVNISIVSEKNSTIPLTFSSISYSTNYNPNVTR